jgi:hypothetical protein
MAAMATIQLMVVQMLIPLMLEPGMIPSMQVLVILTTLLVELEMTY